jgi:hypothetical protein
MGHLRRPLHREQMCRVLEFAHVLLSDQLADGGGRVTHADLKQYVDARRITWDQVYGTLVNARVAPDKIADFMGGEPVLGLYACSLLNQLVASGEVPLQPVAE